MIYMGFNNALKNWKKIVIAAVELAAFLVIMIVAISMYYKQSEMYRPYKKLLESKGVQFCTIARTYSIFGDGESNLSSLTEGLNEVDEMIYSIIRQVRIDGVYDGYVVGLDSMMSEYEPEMAEGVWINDAEERDCINVAVTENPSGVK